MSPASPFPRVHVTAMLLSLSAIAWDAQAQPAASSAPAPAAANPQTHAATPAAPAAGESWVSGAAAAGTNAPASTQSPPPVYYVESVPTGPAPQDGSREGSREASGGGQRPGSGEVEPMVGAPGDSAPPIQLGIEEPPPPPLVHHRAPRHSLWLGARGGLWVPFGDLWGACNSSGMGCEAVRLSSIASSGPMLELDIGARINRNYNLYVLWERAQLGKGGGLDSSYGASSPTRAETDYVALGVRLSTDPDDVGMLLDLAIGARRMRTFFQDDYELQLSQALLESRLGVGADIRLSRTFSLSPMLTLGLGSFGKAEWINATTVSDAVPTNNDTLTHGWVTLHLGGHFDIAGSR